VNRHDVLEASADAYAAVALANVRREFPSVLAYVFDGQRELARPRDVHPAFYGSYDWHSCVEMHWVLARLLRVVPGLAADAEIRSVLDEHLRPDALAAEAAFFAEPRHRTIERPYGWGWALMLAHELSEWDDPDARRWAAATRPLADVLRGRLVEWLPKATYPIRAGTHPNSAFGLSLALPFARGEARAGRNDVEAAIVAAAVRWFADDADYPAAWEPSGADFLSPALTEAELMLNVLDPADFADWLTRFLPGLASGEPRTLLVPATVSDPSDGQIAHLHGLNLSRAWCMRRLAEALPAGDARVAVLTADAERHAEAALPFVVGGDYATEHWLAAYAVLLLSERTSVPAR
jgi:hypothetical protein